MSAPLIVPPPPDQPLRRPLTAGPPSAPRRGFWRGLLGLLSGFGFATAVLVVLGLLTWLATLEMKDAGLHATLVKYFDWRSPWVVPCLAGEQLPLILPGGYLTCVLLFVNLLLGGLLRMRKGRAQLGVMISHAGILMLLVAGGVAHHWSQRGHMLLTEGASSNVAEDYIAHAVEITELKDGRPAAVHVIPDDRFADLTDSTVRTVRLPNLPFDLDLASYHPNARIKAAAVEPPPKDVLPAEGYYIAPLPEEKEAEANQPACIARVVPRQGGVGEPFLLSAAAFHPLTVRAGDRVFVIALRKRQWVLPFTVTLDKFTAEYHPGTQKPSAFRSEVTRTEGALGVKAVIEMNEPMRASGLTFYQSQTARMGEGPDAAVASIFEVVRNPADQWPLYSLCVVTAGLLIHFLTRLARAVRSLSRSRADESAAI